MLASALVAALDVPGGEANPGQDALWVLLTALSSGAAHGYAHVIARRASGDGTASASRLRAVLAEWPLTAAVLPTVAMLLAATAGWSAEDTAADTALVLNTVLLFTLGTSAARTAGLGRLSSCRAGFLDMLIGLVIIAADALIE
ncbi:Integral membrane protein OS=Streptomyces tendae OX=1932 GN=GUR47_06595 PE=4 SV=1 [Streptomyces tendae]